MKGVSVENGWRPCFLVLAVVIAGMAETRPFGPETWFVPDALPQKVAVAGNPLDYAGARIGLDVRNVELPRGWEGGYRYACRFPIIDYVSNRPLFMKQWAEDNSGLIVREHRRTGIGVLLSALDILRGTTGNPELVGTPDKPLLDSFRHQLPKSHFSPGYRDVLLDLLEGYLTALDLVYQGRRNLTREDLIFFDRNPGYFLAPDGKRMPELTGNNSTQAEFIEYARKVKYECILRGAEILVKSVARYVQATRNYRAESFFSDTTYSTTAFEFRLPNGMFRITGQGDDTLDADAVVQIDLGGADVHRNNAGGCRSTVEGIALSIDHAGNDLYAALDDNYVQGFGFLGIGLLVDLAGNDRYVAKHFAQGAGIVGVGALWDSGGDDVYDGHAFVQGAGMFGLGMLLDDQGNDVYDCATLGQGGATTLGLGLLSDLAGNDLYRLGKDTLKDALGQLPGYGQGGALSFRAYPWEGKLTAYGGVGMLVDDQGDDVYDAGGWNDQGGSYIMSLGVLVDNHGSDHYTCGTGQGGGIHVTNAILIDREGDDTYQGGFRAGGGAGDRSPAFLIDYAGNDVYKSRATCYGSGCKPFCFGLLLDYSGDDQYSATDTTGKVTFNVWEDFGGIWPESESYSWPYAVCLDLGGNDDYRVRHRENNTEHGSFGHGIHLDLEWPGGDVIGRIENPLPPYEGVPLLRAMPARRYLEDVLRLKDPDNFRRFQAVGRIVSIGPDVMPLLVSMIMESLHRQFNRDVMECLHYFLVQGKVGEQEAVALQHLLQAKDPEVRTIVADDFGVFKLAGSEDALISALADSAASVRRFALRSLATLKSKKAVPPARELALKDASEDVRRVAVRLLSRAGDDRASCRVLRIVLEQGPGISEQVAAADGVAYGQDTTAVAIDLLREVAGSYDVYLQRAAGKALAELGHVEGISILIQSLSFPSIDAFYNYDNNIPNFIAAYANHDLPESERYTQQKWQDWYQPNQGKIDLKTNVAAYHAFTTLSESVRTAPDTEQIRRYEGLLKQHPASLRIKKVLAGKLNAVAWNMVTAAKGTPEHDRQAGLEHARRATELADDPNYWDTLIEALLANDLNEEALKLAQNLVKRYPDNKMLEDRLAQCRAAKSAGKRH